MATRQGVLTGAAVQAPDHLKAHGPALASRALAWLDRAMLGGATPRGYKREGYPEVEMQRLISGRADRFDLR